MGKASNDQMECSMQQDLIDEIAVTFEQCGNTELSRASKMMLVAELDEYPVGWLRRALRRCRDEVTGKLSKAHIVQRLKECDGRPSSNEAWAMLPQSEGQTVCWTREMAEAYGEVSGIMHDQTAARMAFREAYERMVSEARDMKIGVAWEVSLGHDVEGRAGVVMRAFEDGKISKAVANMILPEVDAPSLPSPVNAEPIQLSDTHEMGAGPVEVASLLEGLDGYQSAKE